MAWLGLLQVEKFLLFTLVLIRVSGLVMTAPIYGTREVPMQVRGLLAFALAVLVTPTQWHTPLAHPGTMLNYLVLVAGELLIGLCLGLGIVILFSGIQLAGELIGRVGGLMLADLFDPAMDAEVPLFSRLMFLLAMAAFVCIGGHRMVMAGLLDTFSTIPVGGAAVPLPIVDTLNRLVTQSFSLGLRAAAPAVTALLLATLVMGLIGRTLPQLNILAVGFGLNAMLSFGVMALTIGAGIMIFQDQVEPALDALLDALHPSPGPGP
ncbi:MAG: flagellar biosynthetic protein FliR [Pirellulales bacterium]|nr:flagellar biosynthetic protein FliR [Pirellulales bacterium]